MTTSRKILNVVQYTKKSNSVYNGQPYESAYHSIQIMDQHFKGQRDVKKRLALMEEIIDFKQKNILDIGCNIGGMLHDLRNKISYGVGIDKDYKCINAANLIKQCNHSNNLSFFVFDCQKEPLALIDDFFMEYKIDICFLLSMAMWINNWQDMIKFCHEKSDTLLYESNGKIKFQNIQYKYLCSTYNKVTCLSTQSMDDPKQKKRKLYLCRR